MKTEGSYVDVSEYIVTRHVIRDWTNATARKKHVKSKGFDGKLMYKDRKSKKTYLVKWLCPSLLIEFDKKVLDIINGFNVDIDDNPIHKYFANDFKHLFDIDEFESVIINGVECYDISNYDTRFWFRKNSTKAYIEHRGYNGEFLFTQNGKQYIVSFLFPKIFLENNFELIGNIDLSSLGLVITDKVSKYKYEDLIKSLGNESVVYMYTHIKSGKKYVGSTINMWKRHMSHRNNKLNTKFSQIIQKEGLDQSFSFEVLFSSNTISETELRNKEQEYIEKFNTIDNGFNGRISGIVNTNQFIVISEYLTSKQTKDWTRPSSNQVKYAKYINYTGKLKKSQSIAKILLPKLYLEFDKQMLDHINKIKPITTPSTTNPTYDYLLTDWFNIDDYNTETKVFNGVKYYDISNYDTRTWFRKTSTKSYADHLNFKNDLLIKEHDKRYIVWFLLPKLIFDTDFELIKTIPI